ncbi:MAG: hypothetical protein RJA76_1338 [Bacteroidota bacterium]|jgi:DNA repair protein RecO (recombination protein O)
MQTKSPGIVLNYIRYRETSILVTIYTRSSGIKSFIENGVRSSKGKHKIALFQPLNLLELEMFIKSKGLCRIAEAKCYFPFKEIPYTIHKSSIALFLTEVLYKVLKEEEENIPLFEFLESQIRVLDDLQSGIENFHIFFLWDLMLYLGIFPGTVHEMFQQLGNRSLELEKMMYQLLELKKVEKLNREIRNEMVKALMDFYHLHLDSMGEIKSLAVLHEVLA